MFRTPFVDIVVPVNHASYRYRCYLARTYLPGLDRGLEEVVNDIPYVPIFVLCSLLTAWRFRFWLQEAKMPVATTYAV
jgi:hypothetical protein